MKLDAIVKYRVEGCSIVLDYHSNMEPLLKAFSESNKSQQVRAILSKPYRERSTGAHSQNSHIWSHITTIAMALGEDVNDIEHYAKVKAISRGYPYHICKLTNEMRPDSMTTINTQEAAALIDALHQLAAEHGIYLMEGE